MCRYFWIEGSRELKFSNSLKERRFRESKFSNSLKVGGKKLPLGSLLLQLNEIVEVVGTSRVKCAL